MAHEVNAETDNMAAAPRLPVRVKDGDAYARVDRSLSASKATRTARQSAEASCRKSATRTAAAAVWRNARVSASSPKGLGILLPRARRGMARMLARKNAK